MLSPKRAAVSSVLTLFVRARRFAWSEFSSLGKMHKHNTSKHAEQPQVLVKRQFAPLSKYEKSKYNSTHRKEGIDGSRGDRDSHSGGYESEGDEYQRRNKYKSRKKKRPLLFPTSPCCCKVVRRKRHCHSYRNVYPDLYSFRHG